ncbi:MAG: hypothetical protein LWW93_15110 [Hyphomicrobiales bacterium]|nr:hypothetical protein [Hyphomicrobiales bacterium]
MSNPILQEFEPLDALVAAIFPDCGMPERNLRDFLLQGVTLDAVRFSVDGGPATTWGQSEYASRSQQARQLRARSNGSSFDLDNIGGFNVFDPNLGSSHSSGWNDETPLDRFGEAASSGGNTRIEVRSAAAFLKRHLGVNVELPSPTTVVDKPKSRGGRSAKLNWADAVDDLVSAMQDPDRGVMKPEEANDWLIDYAARLGETVARSTAQEYAAKAFARFHRWVDRQSSLSAGN